MALELEDIRPHIGQRLELARKDIPMSPACVARELKIQTPFIEAIERLDREALPPIGYVLGYVRAYAGLVGLDPLQAVEDFKRDSEVPENLGRRNQPHFVPRRQIRLPKGIFAATGVIACFGVLGMFYFMKVDAYSSETDNANLFSKASLEASEPVAVDPERMLIKAVAPSMVEIKDKSGKTIIRRVLVSGESWSAHQDAGVTLTARDAGALEVYLGEDLLGRLGPKGVAVADIPMPSVHPEFMTDKARALRSGAKPVSAAAVMSAIEQEE